MNHQSYKPVAPIFVLGPHRSGTSILYSMLIEIGDFAYPTPTDIHWFREYLRDASYQFSKSERFVADWFQRHQIENRYVDTLRAGPMTPEEYGFFVENGRLTPDTIDQFRVAIAALQKHHGEERPLILKNPRDADNFVFLNACFPDAKFVFIHRHPGAVIQSRIEELRSIFDQYSAYQAIIEPDYDRRFDNPILRRGIQLGLRMEPFLSIRMLKEFQCYADYFLQHAARIPDSQRIEISYEELCAAPEKCLEKTSRFLNCGTNNILIAASRIAPRSNRIKENRILRAAHGRRRLSRYLDHCNYGDLWPRSVQLGGKR